MTENDAKGILSFFRGGQKRDLLAEQTPLAHRGVAEAKHQEELKKMHQRMEEEKRRQERAATSIQLTQMRLQNEQMKFEARQRKRLAFQQSSLGQLITKFQGGVKKATQPGLQAQIGPDRMLTTQRPEANRVIGVPNQGTMPLEQAPTRQLWEQERATEAGAILNTVQMKKEIEEQLFGGKK